jgi:hypothetical protein
MAVFHAILFVNSLYGADRHQIPSMSTNSMLRFLEKKVTEVAFSPDFIYSCGMMGLETVRQIVFTKKEELIRMKGFNRKWYCELEFRLAEQGMLRILDDPNIFLCLKPGNRSSFETVRFFSREDDDDLPA